MKIEELPIPSYLKENLLKEGIEELYPPQEEAIKKGVLEGENLVIATPTASGKTLVAVFATAKHLENNGKVLYLTPLRALAAEKYEEFKKYFKDKASVIATYGDYDSSDPWLSKYDIIITTNEKADSLLRHGAEWIKNISLIVIDEIHLLGDSERGPTLEMTVTKILEIVPNAQVLSLSATIKNAEEIANWLKSKLISINWRPVPLKEGVYYDGIIEFSNGDIKEVNLKEFEPVINIALETIIENGQALIFTTTRRKAEKIAEKIAKVFSKTIFKSYLKEEVLQQYADKILEVGGKSSYSEKIAHVIKRGVAYHHAGLSHPYRTLIEDAFRKKYIKILVATPTLCLHPDTFVITMNGAKKIKDLTKNDLVLTHNGRFKKVISPLEREYNGKLLTIIPFGSLRVKMTPEHKVLVIKQTRHKSHLSDGTNKIWYEYDEAKWMKASELYNAFKNNKDNKISFMLLQPIPKVEQQCNRICLKMENSYIHNQYGKTNSLHPANYKTPKYLPLNYEVSRLLGIWIAEGTATKNGAIIFDIAVFEKELTEFIKSTIKKYFPEANIVINNKGKRRRITFCNKRFAEWLRKNIGNNAHCKKIPGILLFNSNRDVKLGLLHGLIDGDGYIRVKNKNRTHYINYTTVSQNLAYQIQILLATLGYTSSILSLKRKSSSFSKRRRDIFNIKISGKSFYDLLKELKIDLGQKEGNRTYNINKIWNNFFLLKIKDIKEEEYSGKVYNLSVEDDESYSIGFIVHNSAGVNLPARTVIIPELWRYGPEIGLYSIPVLEYKQYCGRAGRPRYDKVGYAISIARKRAEKELIFNKYINGDIEKIWSRLSDERHLRSHILAIIASNYANNIQEILQLFEKTFFAKQYGIIGVKEKIHSIIEFLNENEMIEFHGKEIKATKLGKRVSELYIDPLTAIILVNGLKHKPKILSEISILHLISRTPDVPSISTIRIPLEKLELYYQLHKNELLIEAPNIEEDPLEYEIYLEDFKKVIVLESWINELSEGEIYEKYRVEPGDLAVLRESAEWIIYSAHEISKIINEKSKIPLLKEMIERVKHGIKSELIQLARLEGIGRVRARALYQAGFKTIEDLSKAPLNALINVPTIGLKTALLIKKQIGEKVNEEILRNEKEFEQTRLSSYE
ncbi:MAG: DEAD/DEAH box helicase [Nitrososphaerota archaeon]